MNEPTAAYEAALSDTRRCMGATSRENLVQCGSSLKALHSACLRGIELGQPDSWITLLCKQILSDGYQVVEAHCSLMGSHFEQLHPDVVTSLAFGVGHRTLCQKVFEEDPAGLSNTCCVTELFCLTGPLPAIADDLSDSQSDSQSPDMNSEAPIERTATALELFCYSEARRYRTAREGGHALTDEVEASQTAFRQMRSGLQDALTSYADRHNDGQNIALEDLSFARDPEASFDAKQIFHHRDPGMTERALMAAQMIKSIASIAGAVGPSLDFQCEEAHRRLQLARGAYQAITHR